MVILKMILPAFLFYPQQLFMSKFLYFPFDFTLMRCKEQIKQCATKQCMNILRYIYASIVNSSGKTLADP